MRLDLKLILAAVLAVGVLIASASAVVLYQDDFDNDSLVVNPHGLGGGVVNRTSRTR